MQFLKAKKLIAAAVFGAFAISIPMTAEARIHDPKFETKTVERKSLPTLRERVAETMEMFKAPEDEEIFEIFDSELQDFSVPQTISVSDTSIIGTPIATQQQCVRYLLRNNPNPNLAVSPEEIVAYYNAARKATEGHAPAGKQTMTLAALDGGSGVVGNIVSAFEGIAKSALEKNSTATDYIPAHDHGDVKASDVKNAKATSDGKYTTITFDVVDQQANASTKGGDGSVGRAIGVLDGVDSALKELNGVEVQDGIQNIKLTYKNAKVTAKIDESTGRIVGGTWQYRVDINVSSITLKIAILKATLKNVYGAVDYKVVI